MRNVGLIALDDVVIQDNATFGIRKPLKPGGTVDRFGRVGTGQPVLHLVRSLL